MVARVAAARIHEHPVVERHTSLLYTLVLHVILADGEVGAPSAIFLAICARTHLSVVEAGVEGPVDFQAVFQGQSHATEQRRPLRLAEGSEEGGVGDRLCRARDGNSAGRLVAGAVVAGERAPQPAGGLVIREVTLHEAVGRGAGAVRDRARA